MDTQSLAGRGAVITGGSRGIGKAIGRSLAQQGADVALIARTSHDLEETGAAIARETGRRAIGIAADVTDLSALQGALQRVNTELGRLDILVACAGGGIVGGNLDVPDAAWEEQIRLKLLGYIRSAREAVPYMRQSRRRRNCPHWRRFCPRPLDSIGNCQCDECRAPGIYKDICR